jgi:hypothetical protein
VGGFRAGLQSPTNGISGLRVSGDYELTNAAAFRVNNNTPNWNIIDALQQLNKSGFAAAQADVIGHSMGGLLTRIWTQDPRFHNSRLNYGAGNVHKLITIDSPHLGSFSANALALLTVNFTLTQLANQWGWSINTGAVQDLQTSSPAIELMNNNSHLSNTRASVIAGSDSNILDCFIPLWGLMNLLEISVPVLGAPNDTIVAVSSQAPPKSVPVGSDWVLPYCHTNINSKAATISQAVALLNMSVSNTSFFAPLTNGLGAVVQTNPIIPQKLPAVVAQTSSFSITSPSSGAVFAPGSQITVTTQALNGYNPTSIRPE